MDSTVDHRGTLDSTVDHGGTLANTTGNLLDETKKDQVPGGLFIAMFASEFVAFKFAAYQGEAGGRCHAQGLSALPNLN